MQFVAQKKDVSILLLTEVPALRELYGTQLFHGGLFHCTESGGPQKKKPTCIQIFALCYCRARDLPRDSVLSFHMCQSEKQQRIIERVTFF